MAGALSAAIFRRGGPKKELFLVSAEEQDEAELEEKLSELTELLHADKIGWVSAGDCCDLPVNIVQHQ